MTDMNGHTCIISKTNLCWILVPNVRDGVTTLEEGEVMNALDTATLAMRSEVKSFMVYRSLVLKNQQWFFLVFSLCFEATILQAH